MDREQFISSMQFSIERMRHRDMEVFFRLVPQRTPAGQSEDHVARRESVGRRLIEVNAVTLGREPDLRVQADIAKLAEQVAARIGRFGSQDWERQVAGRSVLDHVRTAIGEISAEIRQGESGNWDDDPDPWGDDTDEE